MVGRAPRNYDNCADSFNSRPGERLMTPYSYLQGASVPLCLRLKVRYEKDSLGVRFKA